MPKYRKIGMDLINEPALPLRATMDAERLAELKASIREIGLLNPISLESADGRFEIRAGHRRFLAVRELGWQEIPAMVYAPGEQPPQAIKLHENITQEPLSAAEEAVFFAQLSERYGNDFEGLCKAVRKGENYVSDRLRLLRGDEKVFEALLAREIAFGVARELNKIEQEPVRRMYLDIARRGGCTHRLAAEWVAKTKEMGPLPIENLPPGQEAPPSPSAEPQGVACSVCGGNRDPYNLRWIQIHYFCWDNIQKAIARGGEGE